MARRRRKESGWDVLQQLPWQVTMGLAVVVFVVLRWILPVMLSSNSMTKAILTPMLSTFAWLLSGFLLAAGVFKFVTKKRSASGITITRSKEPRADWKPPAWAPPEYQESLHVGIDNMPLTARNSLVVPISTSEQHEQSILALTWSLDLIKKVEWKRFEDVCQKFYELKGIRSETTPLGADGGIDILLYQDDTGKPTAVVQCKAWCERPVGVAQVRELLGVMIHGKIEKAFFMASGNYSEDATAFAKEHRISLIDGSMLLMMIQRLPEEARQNLLDFATTGDYNPRDLAPRHNQGL